MLEQLQVSDWLTGVFVVPGHVPRIMFFIPDVCRIPDDLVSSHNLTNTGLTLRPVSFRRLSGAQRSNRSQSHHSILRPSLCPSVNRMCGVLRGINRAGRPTPTSSTPSSLDFSRLRLTLVTPSSSSFHVVRLSPVKRNFQTHNQILIGRNVVQIRRRCRCTRSPRLCRLRQGSREQKAQIDRLHQDHRYLHLRERICYLHLRE